MKAKMTDEDKHKQRLRLKAVTKEQWAEAFDDLTEALSSPKLLGGYVVNGPHNRKMLVGARTLYGAHSHYNLGTTNVLYHYQADLIIALYDGKWRWPEGVSLSEMLIRMACSRLPKAVEKYKNQKAKEEELGINTTPVNFDVDLIGKEDEDPDEPDEELAPVLTDADDSTDDSTEKSTESPSQDENDSVENTAFGAGVDIRHKRWELVCAAADDDPQLAMYVQIVGESKRLKDVREKGGYQPGDTDKLIKRLRRKVNKLNNNYGS